MRALGAMTLIDQLSDRDRPEGRVMFKCRMCKSEGRADCTTFAFAVLSAPPDSSETTDGEWRSDLAEQVQWWLAEVKRVSDLRATPRHDGAPATDSLRIERVGRRTIISRWWRKAGDGVEFCCTRHRKPYRPRFRVGSLLRSAEQLHADGHAVDFV